MKNKLIDLNNHLFEELERLNDEELKEYYEKFIELERYKFAERVRKEIDRRKYGKQSNS